MAVKEIASSHTINWAHPIGRSSFQRPKAHALQFFETVMKLYAGEMKERLCVGRARR